MENFPHDLLLTFIPLFVAMDAVGNLPFLLSLTESMTVQERAKTVRVAIITAAVLGLVFLAVGKTVLVLLDIKVADFLVAGGIILLALSIKDLVAGKIVEDVSKRELVAVVPIGTPLLVGPATLTTLLLLLDHYSAEYSIAYATGVILFSLVLNLAAAWLVFAQASRIGGFLGEGGLKAVSKVASLLLAAIAIKMIRLGVVEILAT